MKKGILFILTVMMITACKESSTATADVVDDLNVNIYALQSMNEVKNNFDSIVDEVFNYPYSSVTYTSFLDGSIGIEGPKEPLAQIATNCIRSGEVKVQKIRNNENNIINYRFWTPIESIKNCVIKESNSSINADALIDLHKSSIFKEYSDNPFLREILDASKSDEVITVKEYMDIVQVIIKLDKAGKAVYFEKVIKDL